MVERVQTLQVGLGADVKENLWKKRILNRAEAPDGNWWLLDVQNAIRRD